VGGVVSSIFSGIGNIVGSLFGASQPQQQIQGPSAEEVTAQNKQKALTESKARRESSERATRGRIITARAAGPQTLFTRPGQIPKARTLGGGLRE